MSRIVRSSCGVALVVALVSTATPVAAAPAVADEQGIAATLAAWSGRLLELLNGGPPLQRAAGQESMSTASAGDPEEPAEDGSPAPPDGTGDTGEAERGPGIDPDG